MELKLVGGNGNPVLAGAVAGRLGLDLVPRDCDRFPDGELNVQLLDSVRGCDTYILQPTGPSPDLHIFELLMLADACRRAGARRITAVIPYFGYARQDRRSRGRQPVGSRLVADLIAESGVERIVVVDPHGAGVEGYSRVPVEQLSAVPILVEVLKPAVTPAHVVVSPDLGAVKLAERYAGLLGLRTAVVRKVRVSGRQVEVRSLVGEVRDSPALIIDDMVTTGGTIEAAAGALQEAGAAPEIAVSVTHGLFVGSAPERLANLRLDGVLVSDSVPHSSATGLRIETVSIAGMLAEAIGRLHENRSLADMISYG